MRLLRPLEQGVAARQIVVGQRVVGTQLHQPLVDLQALGETALERQQIAHDAQAHPHNPDGGRGCRRRNRVRSPVDSGRRRGPRLTGGGRLGAFVRCLPCCAIGFPLPDRMGARFGRPHGPLRPPKAFWIITVALGSAKSLQRLRPSFATGNCCWLAATRSGRKRAALSCGRG